MFFLLCVCRRHQRQQQVHSIRNNVGFSRNIIIKSSSSRAADKKKGINFSYYITNVRTHSIIY